MHINVLGVVYIVTEVDIINKNERLLGHIDHVNQEIQLERGLGEDVKSQTLIHEVLHAILHGLGYSELHGDEQLVQSLATALHQVGYLPFLREGV